MAGEASAMALGAGAELVDMEFVQFFPIGHLAPRLVGMDPIMWDPFRYKLGVRLSNVHFEEFVARYGGADFGKYTATPDVASYAILKEVEAGRGSPHGGAYLDFRHIAERELRAAFGLVIDRLLKNGIDLNKMPVEVGPMAHYHMGGIRVSTNMESRIKGLYAAGEAVGGANGANRLSGNAITEAFVFGRRAGNRAAALASKTPMPAPRMAPASVARRPDINPAAEIARLQAVMNQDVGPLRTRSGLKRALGHLSTLAPACEDLPAPANGLDAEWLDLHDLRNMRLVAECVARHALEGNDS